MNYEKVILLRDKEILTLCNNASLLMETVELLENAIKTKEDSIAMKDVELEFTHRENDWIKLRMQVQAYFQI